MQPKLPAADAVHNTAKNAQAQYGVLVSCNKCGGMHDLGVSIVMEDGPVARQSIGELYREQNLPKNLAGLAENSITCPTTGRQSTQKDIHHIFLVPTKR